MGITIEFRGSTPTIKPMNFDYIFDQFDVQADCTNLHTVTAFKVIPSSQFSAQHEAEVQRQKLNQLSQEELMRELQVSLEKTKEADLAKGDFLANMSHEIRTPMNAIIGLSELVLKTQLTSKQQDYISKINSAGRALLGIINDVLDISKIEAGKMDIEAIPFQLDKVLDDLCTIITLRAQEKGIEVIFSIPPEVPNSLTGDPLRLGQILTNLCNNAIKFTETGEIIVKISAQAQEAGQIKLKFEVKDTGIGLKPEQIQKLFTSFSQADTSTTREYGGTGLGLCICKNLVQMMQGEIWVESEYGEGSDFIFTAQFGVLEQELQAQKDIIYTWKKVQGMKVLIVDDNETARHMNEDLMRSYSLNVTTAINGMDAIELVKRAADEKQPYELILMDWQMPEMNGIKASEIIKKSNLELPPKIILMTAYGREEVILKAEDAQIDGFLVKPVNPSTLLHTIMEVMGQGVILDDLGQRNDDVALYDSFEDVRGAKVLLVEDNEVNQIIAIELLETVGLSVEIANNGQEGVEKALDFNYACILMDLQMPIMDGLEASRRLRRSPAHKDVPIIAMTANAMQQDRDQCASAGMNDHIAKPIDTHELYSKLLKWIDPSFKDESFMHIPQDEQSEENRIAIPELQGINTEEGLRRVNGDSVLYLKLLKSFAKQNQDTLYQLKSFIDKKDFVQGEMLAHTLKGTAASLGAHRLSHAASVFEKTFKQGSHEIHDDAWQDLSLALEQVFTSISRLQFDVESNTSTSQEYDIDELQQIAQEIEQQLKRGEFAEEVVGQFVATLKGHSPDEDLEGLVEAIEGFDSDEALEYLEKIIPTIA